MPLELSQALELHATTVALIVIVDPKHEILCRLFSALTHMVVELPLAKETLLTSDTCVTLSSKEADSSIILFLDLRCKLRV